MLQQGLVLLVAGMGIAILFLFVLSLVTTGMSALLRAFPALNVLPDPEPKKKAAPKAVAGEDEAVAAAIAIALKRK